jgi:branched-chain amino acid transport system permease protein
MANNSSQPQDNNGSPGWFPRTFGTVPVLGWLVGAFIAVVLENQVGLGLAQGLGLPKIPVLFGIVTMLKTPALIPQNLAYVVLIYVIPIFALGKLLAGALNGVCRTLSSSSVGFSALVHILILYGILWLWAEVSDYRVLTIKLTLIAVMVTLSLNIINGYMGEFSCSHPGFIALGAYGGSIVSVGLFATDKLLGPALLPAWLGPFMFPVALFAGGALAALGALLVAIPSFKTRGDYLAIISLAFMFIVKSAIENLEVVGGPRGMAGQPDYATLPVVFATCIICIWIINNYVNSTFGKAINAVRDHEGAAESMTVNTRRAKMVAFMFAAFWAGVGGALLAHVLRYVNPATFGLQKLAEVLAMVYFGGLNSVYGSIVGAVSINFWARCSGRLASTNGSSSPLS